MKQFEKHSIVRFVSIYLAGITLIALALFWRYYIVESNRIESEQKVALKLHRVQCERVLKNAPKDFRCTIAKPDFSHKYDALIYEIVIGSILVLLAGMLLSFYLALLSLRPMRDAIEVMDNFVDTMIHDLSTPISSCKLNANALLQQNLTPKQNRRVERILQGLQMMQKLEERLKESMKNAKIDYEDEEIMVCRLCEKFKERSSLITLKCNHPLVVVADPVMIYRVIDNLVSNALKYNQDNNPIEIVIEQDRLKIIDKGVGIKEPNRIFEPYYREKTDIAGLGLGMGIVKSVCDHYNIGISIESKPNFGTTITLNFY